MSATLDGEKFKKYFVDIKIGQFSLESKLFKTSILFLDDMEFNVKLPTKKAKPQRDMFDDDFEALDELLDDNNYV